MTILLRPHNPTRGRPQHNAGLNMLIGASNAALERHIIGRAMGENFWPDAAKKRHHKFRFELPGGIPAAALIDDWGAVLRLDVVAWPSADLSGLGASRARSSVGEAYVIGYLHRAECLWLKDEFTISYMSRAHLPQLAGLTIMPAGYLLGTLVPDSSSRAIPFAPRPVGDAVRVA